MDLAENDPFIYELFDGEIMKRSAPSLVHQRISRKLLGKLDAFIEEKKLGEIFSAPVDLNLDEFNAFQPDLAFVSKERSFLIEDGDYIHGAPDMVVEIISPGTVKRDRVIKKTSASASPSGNTGWWIRSTRASKFTSCRRINMYCTTSRKSVGKSVLRF
ncbi:MAG: Uma2 family endonuclease [Haliscomenobacter sp.]|nr:Uma2 family endonuclease [Haliscomenobacter sp.]